MSDSHSARKSGRTPIEEAPQEEALPTENYPQSSQRLYDDGDALFHEMRFITAAHLFGLSVECAIKAQLSYAGKVARVHLPELVDKARLAIKGREAAGLIQLLRTPGFMEGWAIDNRYWADSSISQEQCARFRDHARRSLAAVNPGRAR